MREKKKAGKCSVFGKWILCMLLVGCMLSTIGCEKARSQVQTAVPQITVKVVLELFRQKVRKKSVWEQRLKVVPQKQQ